MERNRSLNRRKHGKSTDGFRSGGTPIGVKAHSPRASSLGHSERRTDGFYAARNAPTGIAGSATPTSQAELNERDALLEEPIVLDDLDYQKRKKRFHGKPRHSRLRKVVKRTALVLMVLLISLAAFMGYKFWQTRNNLLAGGGNALAVCDGNIPTNLLKKEGDGRVNILLVGIGSEGLLTDTLMIASVDPFTHKVDLLSIPRDLWVNIPGNGQQKINAAYEFGQKNTSSKEAFDKKRAGVELLDKVIEQVAGIDVHYHAVFNFKAFKQVVDSLGGVTVNVPETLYDPSIAWENKNNPVIATKGIQNFDGNRALLYAKSRKTSSDYARAERQRLLLVAMKDKALSAGTYSNPVKIISLLNSLGGNVYSDFDTRSIKCLQKEVSKVSSSNIKSLDLVTPPHDLVGSGNIAGLSTVMPRAGTFVYNEIHKFVRSTLVDGLIARENSSIAVYNASNTSGAATKMADMLKSYGYKVTVVENAPNRTNPGGTTLVDLTKGRDKYTRNYLQLRLGTIAGGDMPGGLGITPPQGTSFVIIVGSAAASN